ncbi:MAG: FIST C-terminal domain-containing protein [Planctomycetota bacterium]|jgi:hypothetical protein|nr:FIST C-terminal domain-containing protein [Planctomycetota bacterium]
MRILSKSARADNPEQAIRSLQAAYAGFPVRTLFFFASSRYTHPGLAELVRDAFPGALTIGCSSYGELAANGINYGGVSALAFAPDALEIAATAVVKGISAGPEGVVPARAELERRIGSKLIDLDYRKYFGIALFDGSSQHIEAVMDRLGDSTNLTFIGGFASDDFSMTGIRQYLNGETFTDAAVLTVLKPAGPFALLKTQSADRMPANFVVTRANQKDRVILELDNRPAADVYAENLGVARGDIRDETFLMHPFGLMAAEEPFIRAIHRILPDGGIQLFCSVRSDQRLFLMRTGDIVAKTSAILAEKRRILGGGVRAILDFDCAHRFMTLQLEKRIPEYAALFQGIETAGFASFGECYIANVNQTSVMALFG